jgi:peroxiredoxin
LVFFDPQCAFSRKLLPSLAALTSEPVHGRPTPLVITTGSRADNRGLFDGAGFSGQVLLQTDTEVAAAYKVDGTPMSYLIDADGTIASDIAVGLQSTLILAGSIASVTDATDTYTVDHTAPGLATDLEATATLRDGLRPGTSAPIFRLPRVDGGELSLLEYRGRAVVLVFFDPDCAPCDELAPRLQAVQGRAPELALVMISRGEPDATRAKVEEFGLSFPVILQRHWEISREYGIFATPVAFHIDEWGVIADDVAVGNDRIIDLLEAVAASQERREQRQLG